MHSASGSMRGRGTGATRSPLCTVQVIGCSWQKVAHEYRSTKRGHLGWQWLGRPGPSGAMAVLACKVGIQRQLRLLTWIHFLAIWLRWLLV